MRVQYTRQTCTNRTSGFHGDRCKKCPLAGESGYVTLKAAGGFSAGVGQFFSTVGSKSFKSVMGYVENKLP